MDSSISLTSPPSTLMNKLSSSSFASPFTTAKLPFTPKALAFLSDYSASSEEDEEAVECSFYTTTYLHPLVHPYNDVIDPFSRGGRGRRGWAAQEDREFIYLKEDLPALGKEDVKVTLAEDVLFIKGEEVDDEEGGGRKYGIRINLAEEKLKMEEIKTAMKNGGLKIVVPKVKEEELKDVVHIKLISASLVMEVCYESWIDHRWVRSGLE